MSNYNILVVDDEEIICQMMKSVITEIISDILSTDISVKCVNSSKEAIDEVKSNNYHLIFLDINLGVGEVNGIETLKMIKQIKPEQVVYMNTGYPVDDKAERIIEKHALGILHKPYRIPKLIQAIKDSLKI